MALSNEFMPDVGIVVIGRNEGERLTNCLMSIFEEASCPVVYVDSGSSDNSIALARSLHTDVLELDTSLPFSAARARNEGLERLIKSHPETQFIQFIDGDCTLISGWLDAARNSLLADSERAAVTGHLQERSPDATPYNRLCAIEWSSPTGELTNYGSLGGLSMIRVNVLLKLGGFNPQVIAGEDSELGVRMGLAGYKVTKINHPMATHDANITTFRQWWIRAIRAGHAIGQRAQLHGNTQARDCMKERTSTWVWGIALPITVLLTLLPTNGLSVVMFGAYIILYYRVIRFRRSQGDSPPDASLYARFLLLAKFANGIGLIKFYLNRLARRYEIIEYK